MHTATCKINGNRSTDRNGFLYQFTTKKTLETVARFPIILQVAVPVYDDISRVLLILGWCLGGLPSSCARVRASVFVTDGVYVSVPQLT